MTITVRLDPDTEKALIRAAMAKGMTKSEFVRCCLREYLGREQDGRLAWKLGKDLFGRHSSDRSDLARNSKRIVREKIRAKKSNR